MGKPVSFEKRIGALAGLRKQMTGCASDGTSRARRRLCGIVNSPEPEARSYRATSPILSPWEESLLLITDRIGPA